MPLPLRKIVSKIEIEPTYHEQNMIDDARPTRILPFREYITEESDRPKQQQYLDFIKYTNSCGGIGNVKSNILHAYKSGHANPQTGIWNYWDKQIWKMCEKEFNERNKPAGKPETKQESTIENKEYTYKLGRDTIQSELHEKTSNKDRMYIYLWTNISHPELVKMGERFVHANKDPVQDIYDRVTSSTQVERALWTTPATPESLETCAKYLEDFPESDVSYEFVLNKVIDVSDIAEKLGKNKAGSHMDSWVAEHLLGINPISQGSEIYEVGPDKEYEVTDENKKLHTWGWQRLYPKVTKFISDEGQPLKKLGLSAWQAEQAEEIIRVIKLGYKKGETQTHIAALCPRFGKTIWASMVAKELGTPLTVVTSWWGSSLTSFSDDLSEYEIFKDMEVVDLSKEDKIVDEKTGEREWERHIHQIMDENIDRKRNKKRQKQVVALVSLGKGDKRDERIASLMSSNFTTSPKLLVVDEADYGAWREGQSELLSNSRQPGDTTILMTGSNADRSIGENDEWGAKNIHGNVVYNHTTVYPEIIWTKYNYDKQKKHSTSLHGVEIDPTLHDLVVPVQFYQMALTDIIEYIEKHKKDDPDTQNFLDPDNFPTWAKYAKYPTKAKGFFTTLLKSMFPGDNMKESILQTNVDYQIETANREPGIKEKRKNNQVLDKPRRAMMFMPGNISNDNLDLAAEQAREALPGWNIVSFHAGESKNTNKKASHTIKNLLALEPKKPLLILSSGKVGSRSFSVGEISEVYLAYDEGDMGATLQKCARAFTFDKRKNRPPKIARIFSLAFNPNRDEKFFAYIMEAAKGLKDKGKVKTIAAGLKEILPTVDAISCSSNGAVRYNYDTYMKKMFERDNLSRVLARLSNLSGISDDIYTQIKALKIKPSKLQKQKSAKVGRTMKKTLKTFKGWKHNPGFVDGLNTEDKSKLRVDIAGIIDQLRFIIPDASAIANKKYTTFSEVMIDINKNPTLKKRVSGRLARFNIPYSLVKKLVDVKVIPEDIVEFYHE